MTWVLIAALMLLLANEITRSNRLSETAGRLRFENRDLLAEVAEKDTEIDFLAGLALEPVLKSWEPADLSYFDEAARHSNVVSLSAVRAAHGGSAA